MKLQYETPRLTIGVVAAVAIVIPILLGYFLISGMANSPGYEGLTNLGKPGTSSTTTTSASSGTVLTGVVNVSIPNGAGNPSGAPGYDPDNITVAVGTTVVWTNNDPVHHTVTSPPGNGTISSGDMAQGATFNYTFTKVGTYNIICVYHSWMKQTIKVVAGSGSSGPTVETVSIPNGAGLPSGGPGYAPDVLHVTAGSTVIWTNNDTAHHTVTSVAGNGTINSPDMPPGATFNFTFTTPGTYNYICTYHSWMKGTVIVSAASTGASGSSAVAVSIPVGAGNPSGAPGYSPDVLHVTTGTTVTWTNNDPVHHTVTSVPGNGSLNSPDMPQGATYSFTFNTPGTYNYICVYHSWMTGTVVVTGSPVSGSNSSASSSASSSSSATATTSTSSSGSASSLTGIPVSMPAGAGNGPASAPGFAPAALTLVIGVNNTVTWTNNDSPSHHDVASTSVPSGASAIASPDMPPGATFTYTFTVPGTYQIVCTYHSWMMMTVTVVQG